MKIIYSPQDVITELNQTIIGNDKLKKVLGTLGFMYNVKCFAIEAGIRLESLPRFNMFISGSSGSGKTEGVLQLAKILDVPMHRIDCSTIVAHGWEGTGLDTHLEAFLKKSPSGLGIILLDEIDKKSMTGKYGDYQSYLQDNLLDLLDGAYSFKKSQTPFTSNIEYSKINNALIILSGSFENYRRDNKMIKNLLGFKMDWKNTLIDLGFKPELVKRLVTFAETDEVTEDSLKEIFNIKSSVLDKYVNLFYAHLHDHEFPKEEFIKTLIERDQGFREIDTIMFDYLLKHFNRVL